MQNQWTEPIPFKALRMRESASVVRLSAYYGFLAAMVFWSGVIVVGLIQPEYHPLADTVSKMGRVGRSFAMAINWILIVTGFLIAMFARGLPASNGYLLSPRLMVAAFGFFGLAGAGLLPCDEICVGWSLPNILHTIPVAIGFTCLQFGLLQLANMKIRDRSWFSIPAFAWVLFYAGLVAVSLHFLGRWSVVPILDSYLGLSEKLYLAALFALILLISLRMHRANPLRMT